MKTAQFEDGTNRPRSQPAIQQITNPADYRGTVCQLPIVKLARELERERERESVSRPF